MKLILNQTIRIVPLPPSLSLYPLSANFPPLFEMIFRECLFEMTEIKLMKMVGKSQREKYLINLFNFLSLSLSFFLQKNRFSAFLCYHFSWREIRAKIIN